MIGHVDTEVRNRGYLLLVLSVPGRFYLCDKNEV